MKNKVVINNCYGGFGLSEKAIQRYNEISDRNIDSWDALELPRHDPVLVQVVEELGDESNGRNAALSLEEIPGNRYYITEYDGIETVYCPEDDNWIVIED